MVKPTNFFTKQINKKHQNIITNFNNLNIITNQKTIHSNNNLLKTIINFHNKNKISTLNTQLTQIKQYIKNLHTLQHKHLN